ncbi:hypothetical protein GGR09_001604 [Bartonella heixiaziensis]
MRLFKGGYFTLFEGKFWPMSCDLGGANLFEATNQ